MIAKRTVTLPQLGLIAGTRAVLGAGIGLLLGERLDRKPRRAVGWTLLAVGALSTVPLVAKVLRNQPQPAPKPTLATDGEPRRPLEV